MSYLSMIENGKRVPSERLLAIIAEIFQKDSTWFFDDSLDEEAIGEILADVPKWKRTGESSGSIEPAPELDPDDAAAQTVVAI